MLLTGVVATVRITDFVAEVTLQHRFENTDSSPLEATFEMLVAQNARHLH